MWKRIWSVSRDWLLYLDDVIDSAEKIQRFVRTATLDKFLADELLFDAVLYNLQVIGEAVKKLPDEAKAMSPGVDWSGPARMRDLIAHHYFAVDPQIVWEAATMHVPALLQDAKALRSRLDQADDGPEQGV
jgi:uncharacterized protein with HEPN domain